MPTGLGLVRHPTDAALLSDAIRRHDRVGLAGLTARPSRRGRWGVPPAPNAVAGFRWGVRDERHPHWWPQGIDVLPGHGERPTLIAVSWFSQRGRGARVSFVEPRADAPRYRHVILAAPAADAGRARLGPVDVHAGGIAVVDDRVYVAATHGGLREFHLDDLLRLRRREHGIDGRLVLPQSAHLEASTASGGRRLRYSFVSAEEAPGGPGLVVGEYGKETGGRLARVALDAERRSVRDIAEVTEIHDPGIPGMQGALVHHDTWIVSATTGAHSGGDLWVGGPGSFVRLPGELAPGPEDLALWPERAQLWTVSEYPGHRWVYALDLADVFARARRAGHG